MKIVILEKGKYVFVDADLPEIRNKIQEISEVLDELISSSDCEKTEHVTNSKSNNIDKTVTLDTLESEVIVCTNDIISIEVYKNNCFVYTIDHCYKLKRGSLENTIKNMADSCIVRCHKSYGINVRWLEGWKKKERHLWDPIYRENINVPCRISSTYYEKVRSAYMQFHHRDKSAEL